MRSRGLTNIRREVDMAAVLATQLDTRCPVCGADLLSLDNEGHVALDGLKPVSLHRLGDSGEGYAVCDECAYLANLTTPLTLN
jgi:hypothetical protein